MLDRCIEELNKLRAEFEAHRDEANRNLDQLNNEMPNKADKKDLFDLENRIMEKLKDMIQQILNQFANRWRDEEICSIKQEDSWDNGIASQTRRGWK